MIDSPSSGSKPHTWALPPGLLKNIFFPIIIVLLSTCFFYYINSSIEEFHNWPALKYKSGDSTSYLNSGKWFLNQVPLSQVEESVATRPFFYSLVLASLEQVHPQAIQAYQFALWLVQIIIVYYCGILISSSSVASFFLSLICAVVLSPVGIALHALSETTASFFIVLSFKNKERYIFVFLYLLALSLCSVVKPVYFYAFIVGNIISLVVLKKFNGKTLLAFVFILISVIPIFYQISIMKSNFDITRISYIDTYVINDYFLSLFKMVKTEKQKNKGGVYFVEKITKEGVAGQVKKEGYRETDIKVKIAFFQEIYDHPKEVIQMFFYLIGENTSQYSFFLSSEDKGIDYLYKNITIGQNLLLRSINIFSLFICFFFFFIKNIYMEKELINNYSIVSFSFFTVIFLTYMSTGITFWQGDRFMIPIYFISLIWLFFQLNTIFVFFRIDKGKKGRGN
ncbi:MAG: hypothetical protein D3925_01665 [Candidatus Electrothrix sp. AR5]|nr:hypothetical protein [Candidatus Electrothrix sp. AR5]